MKLFKEGQSSQNVAKYVSCSRLAVSTIRTKDKQREKVAKSKHTSVSRKTSG